MEQIELNEILKKHSDWLRTRYSDNVVGERADLYRADLHGADLYRADLQYADLYGADLQGADLWGANLCGADLQGADLWGANLCGADLRRADLQGADLRSANLCGADLQGADLRSANLCDANLWSANLQYADLYRADLQYADLYGAKNIFVPLSCPEKGSFIGFKRAHGYIVELEILEDARRSSATSRKCRCDKAKVLSITASDGAETTLTQISSDHDADFIYKLGEIVEEPNYDTNRFNECAPGIHFFITRQEAVNY